MTLDDGISHRSVGTSALPARIHEYDNLYER